MQGEERQNQHMVRSIFGLAIHSLLLRPGEGKADFPNRKRKKKKIAREKDQKAHGDEDINFSLTMYL